jgi:hypothetical protein
MLVSLRYLEMFIAFRLPFDLAVLVRDETETS